MFDAVDRDVDSRLSALEDQQRRDHEYFLEMAGAARMLGTAIDFLGAQQHTIAEDMKGFTAVDLTIKRDVAALMSKCDEGIHGASSRRPPSRPPLLTPRS